MSARINDDCPNASTAAEVAASLTDAISRFVKLDARRGLEIRHLVLRLRDLSQAHVDKDFEALLLDFERAIANGDDAVKVAHRRNAALGAIAVRELASAAI